MNQQTLAKHDVAKSVAVGLKKAFLAGHATSYDCMSLFANGKRVKG